MHDLDKYALSFLKNNNFYSIYDIIIFICVFLAIIMSQYFFTLNNSRLLCGSIQPLYCVYNILISWGIFLLIFSLANKFWLKPFSNTFGYLFLSFFMNLPEKLNNILSTKSADFIGKEWVFVNEIFNSLDPKTFQEQWNNKNNITKHTGGASNDTENNNKNNSESNLLNTYY